SPLLTYAMSLGLGAEPFQPRRAAGILLGLAGTLMIILPRTSLPAPDLAPWAVLALLTPACYAVGNIIIARWRPPGTGSLALACAMQVVATILLIPAVLATDSFHPLWPPLSTADVAIISHMVAAALGALLWFELVRMTGPVFMSQVAYVVTLTGVLWGMYFFDERHSPWFWAAAATIFLGLMLVVRPAQAAVRHSRG
ncbi:MAG: DMT family transporter, partial [Proteobacteria bacterium]|nr:DMT family transporter [Pseudomonadota bacterium]